MMPLSHFLAHKFNHCYFYSDYWSNSSFGLCELKDHSLPTYLYEPVFVKAVGVCVCVGGGGGLGGGGGGGGAGLLGVVGLFRGGVEYNSNVEETNRERTVFISPTKK